MKKTELIKVMIYEGQQVYYNFVTAKVYIMRDNERFGKPMFLEMTRMNRLGLEEKIETALQGKQNGKR